LRAVAKDAMQDATITAASPKTSMDLPSIRDLSRAMASSLNLAPLTEGPSSALEILATVSSNMRNDTRPDLDGGYGYQPL
jgi:hypothetical protein